MNLFRHGSHLPSQLGENRCGAPKLSLIGLIVTLGIVYGDIGTSPLYVMKAIVGFGAGHIDFDYITGAVSCVIWTLTMQTTVKYVIITLRADNKGEGGILALYALVRKKKKSLVYLVAIVGAATLVADGIITPAITVTSAVEGLNNFTQDLPIVGIVIGILVVLFAIQQFGTHVIGRLYGPVMLLWFVMLGILGVSQIVHFPKILYAFNPMYAIELLVDTPYGFLLLGAVFLCTTGAEALYSDLGHCGIKNIRISWVFVKIMLILNYLGQGAWLLTAHNYTTNPFFGIMPSWFLVFGVIIATAAAIIASQSLISGSFTIFNEAMSLNFWPRQHINHPSNVRGPLYIPFVNWFLMFACIAVVLIFQDSSNMEAAYGLSITITMLMTSVLLLYYMKSINYPLAVRILFAVVFFTIEISFLVANMFKFMDGGVLTIALAGIFVVVMYVWYNGRKIKNKYLRFLKIQDYAGILTDIKNDTSIPKYATNLVYLSKADLPTDVDGKIVYSIINKNPKRADHYWLVHIHYIDEPYTHEYSFEELIPDTLFRVEFKIGFRVDTQVNLHFRQVVTDLVQSHEISGKSGYASLQKHDISGDFKFIVIHRVHNYEYGFSFGTKIVMRLYNLFAHIGISDVNAYGLDTSSAQTELVPLIIGQRHKGKLVRVDHPVPS